MSVRRRGFLGALAGGAASALLTPRAQAASAAAFQSVRGPLDATALGTTLVHEHVLVDFAGAETVSRSRYDADEVFRVALPHLTELRSRGCQTLLECTPAYLGRDPLLLRRLSEASGLQIVTNTGYYGAARDIAVPKHAYSESPKQLAARWTAEYERGIEGTGIRPGFVKIGVDSGPLSAIDRKLVEAGALTHLATGLTLAIHTGDGRAALEILGALARFGIAAEAYVWVHAQSEPDRATRAWAAQQGAWVELDGVSPRTLDSHVEAVLDLHSRNRLDRVLVSQDAGWYHVGEPAGAQRGLADAEIHALLVRNPVEAFGIRRRVVRSS